MFLTVESRDLLHMCLSEIAQALQVFPVWEIKLAALFIDFSVQKEGAEMLGDFSPSLEHQVILDGLPMVCHFSQVGMGDRQQSRPNLIFGTWVTLRIEKYLRTKQTAEAFLQGFALWRKRPRLSLLIPPGRRQILREMPQH